MDWHETEAINRYWVGCSWVEVSHGFIYQGADSDFVWTVEAEHYTDAGAFGRTAQEVDAVQVISPSAVEETAEEEDEVAGSEEDSPVIIQSLESVDVKEDEGERLLLRKRNL